MILPTYRLPTRKTISSSLVPKLYQSTKEKVLELTAEAEAVCLTTDGWTSINNTAFIALTAHFINKNSLLKSVLLGCSQLDERHTAQNLSNFLKNETSNWGITNKIAGIITDNAANIVAAVHLTTWRHFPCFAHTVNLVVQHSLNAMKPQLDKVKMIVEYFKHSSSANSRLQAMQTQMELPPLKLKQSVVTRWNSTYDMLTRILKIKDAVVSTLAIEQPRLNTLSPEDWLLIEQCINILKIFYEVTEEISAEKSVTISKVMLLVKIMKNHVTKNLIENGSDQYLQLLNDLQEQLNSRFRDLENNILVTEASFLDPRFKKHAFTTMEKYDTCLKGIKRKLRSLAAQDSIPLLEIAPTMNEAQASSSTSSMWADFDKEVENDIIKNPTAAINLDKETLPQTTCVKYLGFYLDRRLTWKDHIKNKRDDLNNRFRNLLWLLGRQSVLSLNNKLLVYCAILKPIWLYGIQIWSTASTSNTLVIQRAQNRILRTIANAPWYSRNTEIHQYLEIPTIQEEIKKHKMQHRTRLLKHPNPLACGLLTADRVKRLKRADVLDTMQT
ncbi:E3 SUMO-protein ligase ZBED1-like [Bicyclus anynana]|uniref:E3 SUMO-protein ligase ZBED1-like n=1 Tax=Bicyclus anynana TaxID=110368 RepID=A0ABM3M0J9_BICAN|nr:E3 SUMO-protein ligase ZBED1-like [Bicyclus anynana]